MKTITYKIEITPTLNTNMCAAKPHVIEMKTLDIERSMEQYQRNRNPLTWKILEQDGNNDD